MNVITRKRLNEFTDKHPDTKSALARWYALMRKGRFSNFVQLREVFPQADQVGKFTVFNVAGNRARLPPLSALVREMGSYPRHLIFEILVRPYRSGSHNGQRLVKDCKADDFHASDERNLIKFRKPQSVTAPKFFARHGE